MDLGMVGLGRMGANMVRRIMRAGHRCVVYDLSADAVRMMAEEGAVGAETPEDLVRLLPGAAHRVADGPRGRRGPFDLRDRPSARDAGTSWWTAEIPGTSMTSAGRESCPGGESTMSMSGPAAGCGGRSADTAS